MHIYVYAHAHIMHTRICAWPGMLRTWCLRLGGLLGCARARRLRRRLGVEDLAAPGTRGRLREKVPAVSTRILGKTTRDAVRNQMKVVEAPYAYPRTYNSTDGDRAASATRGRPARFPCVVPRHARASASAGGPEGMIFVVVLPLVLRRACFSCGRERSTEYQFCT